ncbi:hypothetical protein P7K49_025219 [Saguinus oedipus]|uniref:Protein FAM221A n=1 Tax=Saguinus oedipus TaxID=9490 RepID=A0ABQ9UGL3_SAGOE|nr:hypothetical protein P7K49_025219 [Saguinus oedipus]
MAEKSAERKGSKYKQHKTDLETIPQQRPIDLPCRVTGCQCRAYHYVPLNGTQPIRCRCKHFADQHSAAPGFTCNACSKCSGFHSCFTCACGQPAYAHDTVVETKQERLAQGKPVGQDVPYAAMGGLTGFSSLAEGYMRLDDSGIGAPSVEFLESPTMAVAHPFLKAFQASSSSSPETLTDAERSTLSLAPQEPADRALGSVRSPVLLPTTPAQITLPRKLLVWLIVQVLFNQMDMPICPCKSQIAGLTGHPDQ